MRLLRVAAVILGILFAIHLPTRSFAQGEPAPSNGTKPAALAPAPVGQTLASPLIGSGATLVTNSLPFWTWMQSLRMPVPAWGAASAPVFVRGTNTRSSRSLRGRSASR